MSIIDNKTSKLIAIVMALMVFTTMGLFTGEIAQGKTVKPTKLYLKATTRTVDVNGRTAVKVYKTAPSNASKAVTFKSSNTKILKVSSKGSVRGIKKGTARIYVTSKVNKKVRKYITINVKDLKPTSVEINTKLVELEEGQSYKLNAKINPTGVYNKGLIWNVPNKSVAKIDATGKITAIKEGKTIATVVTKEGFKDASCQIVVVKKGTKPEKPDKPEGGGDKPDDGSLKPGADGFVTLKDKTKPYKVYVDGRTEALEVSTTELDKINDAKIWSSGMTKDQLEAFTFEVGAGSYTFKKTATDFQFIEGSVTKRMIVDGVTKNGNGYTVKTHNSVGDSKEDTMTLNGNTVTIKTTMSFGTYALNMRKTGNTLSFAVSGYDLEFVKTTDGYKVKSGNSVGIKVYE